jgi:hypothetical protein
VLPSTLVWDTPTIQREKLYAALDYVERIENKLSVLSIPQPRDEMIALVYALLSYHTGYRQESMTNYFFEKARALASTQFDQVLSNQTLAIVYGILAHICVTEGQTDKAFFYMSSLRNYIDFNVREQGNSWHEPTIYGLYNKIIAIFEEINMSALWKGFISKMYDLQKFYQHKIESLPSPLVRTHEETALANCTLVTDEQMILFRKDLTYRQDNNSVTVQQFEEICAKMYELLEGMKGFMHADELQTRRITSMLFQQGFKIERASKTGDDIDARHAADMVSSLTLTKWFPYLSPMLVIVLVLASRLHAKLLAKARDESEKSLILERVKDDYKALVLMSQRHKHLSKVYEKLIRYLDHVIRTVDESKLLYRIRTPLDRVYNFDATLFNFASGVSFPQNELVLANDEINLDVFLDAAEESTLTDALLQ